MALTVPGVRIVEKLAEGGSSVIYRAEDMQTREARAVKVLRPQARADAKSLKAFHAEAELLRGLDHEGIVRVFATGSSGGEVFTVLELFEGANLKRLLQQKSPDLARLGLPIFAQAAEALCHLHLHGIIHKDVKPENLLVQTTTGRVKLIDLSIAERIPSGGGGLLSAFGLGRKAVPAGTPSYMSPEQIQARPLDHRTDVYSLGATMYEVFAGTPPFIGRSQDEILQKHLKETPRSLLDRQPDLPVDVGRMVMQMLEKDPIRRPDLHAVLRRLSKAMAPPPPRPARAQAAGRPAPPAPAAAPSPMGVSAPVPPAPAGAPGRAGASTPHGETPSAPPRPAPGPLPVRASVAPESAPKPAAKSAEPTPPAAASLHAGTAPGPAPAPGAATAELAPVPTAQASSSTEPGCAAPTTATPDDAGTGPAPAPAEPRTEAPAAVPQAGPPGPSPAAQPAGEEEPPAFHRAVRLTVRDARVTFVRVRRLQETGKREGLDGFVVNLSKAGLGFECTASLEPGEEIQMVVVVPPVNQAVRLTGIVRWCDPAESGLQAVGVFLPAVSLEYALHLERLRQALRDLD